MSDQFTKKNALPGSNQSPGSDPLTAPLSLKGIKVLLTREAGQTDNLAQKILALGGEAQLFPVIAIEPPESFAELDQALDHLDKYDWILFASVNAVDHFLARFRERGLDRKLLTRLLIAAIGPATSSALSRYQLEADFTPKTFVAEALIAELRTTFDLQGKKMLWPRNTLGRQLIKDELTKDGAQVDVVTAYTTGLPAPSLARATELVGLLSGGNIDAILLASSQSVKNFATILNAGLDQRSRNSQGRLPAAVLGKAKIITIGPETSKTVEAEFFTDPIQARSFTMQGMIERLVEYVHERDDRSFSADDAASEPNKLGKNL